MIQIKVKYFIAAAIAILNVVFFGGWGISRLSYESASDQIIASQTQLMNMYVYTIGDLQKEVIQKSAVIISQKEAIREGELAREELKLLKIKHLSEITKLKAEVKIMFDSISHTGVVAPVPPCDTEEYLPSIYLPFRFVEKNRYVDMVGEFDENGTMSMDLTVPAGIDVYISKDKNGYKTTVTTDNPYLRINDMISIKTDTPDAPSRWGIGAMGGVGMPIFKLKPSLFIGVGVTYDLLRFN